VPKHGLAWDCMGCGHQGNQGEQCIKCGRARGKAKLYDYLDLSETTAGHKVPLWDVLDRLTTIKRPRPPSPQVAPSRPRAAPPPRPAPPPPARSGRWLMVLLVGAVLGTLAAWLTPNGRVALLTLRDWLQGVPH
jgi:hypothetical protein